VRGSIHLLLKGIIDESIDLHFEGNLHVLNLLIFLTFLFVSDAHDTVFVRNRLLVLSLFDHKNPPKGSLSQSPHNLEIVEGLFSIFVGLFLGKDVGAALVHVVRGQGELRLDV
jgi:hypothetical protein